MARARLIDRRRKFDASKAQSEDPDALSRLILFGLFLAELVTVLDVSGLIGWHVVLGALRMPFALVKTCSTSWRVFRY